MKYDYDMVNDVVVFADMLGDDDEMDDPRDVPYPDLHQVPVEPSPPRRFREPPAPLPDWMNDPTKLPKAPPGRSN
jgi:hypothetical protein